MSIATDTDLLLDSLHEACEYTPKRAIRYFIDPDNRSQAVPLLLEEMKEVLQNPDHYIEHESQFLFHAVMILAFLKEEEAVPFFMSIGHLEADAIEVFLGKRLYDSVSLAYAELFQNRIEMLKQLVEDPEQDPLMRASALQAFMLLFGKGVLNRKELIDYFLYILKKRKEKILYIYDLIAAASTILHPAELIDELRLAYAENYIDSEQVSLKEIEEMLEHPQEEIAGQAQGELNTDLEDLIAHYELAQGKRHNFERNDPCPCCSGLKYKKCCY